MPWKVEKRTEDGAERYCVVKKEDGETVKCHDAEADAEKHMRALYASEKAFSEVMAEDANAVPGANAEASESDKSMMDVDVPPVGGVPGADACLKKHMDAGLSKAEARKKCEREHKAHTEQTADKALLERIWDRVSERLGKAFPALAPGPEHGSFQVFKDRSGQSRWLASYSNNFADRDGEIFSERGIDAFISRVDMGVVPMPELWSWHTPGTRYGQADWVDRAGHFVVASGTYDDTELGRRGKAYDEGHQKDYGVSHGFMYKASGIEWVKGKRVYHDFNTFEVSPLVKGFEANTYTGFAVETIDEVKEASMNAEKRAHLVEKFGEDYVRQLETETEKRGKAIEGLAAYKDFVHPEGETESKTEGQKRNDVPEDTAALFKEFLPAVVEDTGEAVIASLEAVKAVTALQKTVTELQSTVKAQQTRLDTEFSGRPRRASKAAETTVDEDDPAVVAIDKDQKREKVKGALPGIYGDDDEEIAGS